MIDLFDLYGIDVFAPIPLAECTVKKPYLLDQAGLRTDGEGSALIFLLPYYTSGGEGGNVSMYAVAGDYHGYCRGLFADLCPRLREALPGCKFAGFADHSPILEVEAAAKAGLGVMGENGLLISREYSSFVFIGGIFTDAGADAWESLVGRRPRGEYGIMGCLGCGECRRRCPAGAIGERGSVDREKCLSAVTQKKKLTPEDEAAVAGADLIWGCDVCQLVCPYTAAARRAGTLETGLSFFRERLIKTIDEKTITELAEGGELEGRAFAWRGEDVIRRNVRIKNKTEIQK